ncbi:MAG: IclR family transcriptional regulator [Eubacteriales bacterium]
MKINKSASRAMDLLLIMSEQQEPMTLLEIEHAMGMPKSSTFELVHTMLEKEFLEQHDKKYALGINAFKVGISYLKRIDVVTVAHDILVELSRITKETVFLGANIENQILYVDKHSSFADMASTCKIGTTKELYYTSLGKAILATFSQEELKMYFENSDYYKFNERTIVDLDQMIVECARTREFGYAQEDREGTSDSYCVGAPILNHNNRAVAAISITSPHFRMTEERILEFGAMVAKAALEVSRKIGYRGSELYK